MHKSVSVIIPSYNSAKTIKFTLNALKNLKGEYLKEIIVVDSSDDREMEKIISTFQADNIKFINAGTKVIPSIGRNIGAEHASGTILAFIDADAYPAEDWLEHIVKAYGNGYKVGGGSIELPDFQKNKLIAAAQYYLQFNEFMSIGHNRPKDFAPSCNLFCEKKIFQKVGGYPEIRASEDTLFGLKINEMTQFYFLPEAKVYHIFRENWKDFLNNQKLLGKYVMIYRRKHYDAFIYKGIMPIVLFPAFLSIKLYRIITRIFTSNWTHIYPFITSFPIFLIGLLFWSIGFINGSFNSNE